MMPFLKGVVARIVPTPALQLIRRSYYARLLQSITPDLEMDIKLLSQILAPGEVAVDIGANIGTYTKFLSRLVGPQGRVYSIEPIPETFQILCSNIKKLHLQNVVAENCALSDHDGRVTMEIPRWDYGGENLYMAQVVEDARPSRSLRRLHITCKTLDSLLAKTPPPSFIKCDVEGHELQCVMGARQVITQGHPMWLIEVSGGQDLQGSTGSAVYHLMKDFGYEPYRFDGSQVVKQSPGEGSLNVWFFTPAHVQRLRERSIPVLEG